MRCLLFFITKYYKILKDNSNANTIVGLRDQKNDKMSDFRP